jgi:hypothetical protein
MARSAKKKPKKPKKHKATLNIPAHTRAYPKALPQRTVAGRFKRGKSKSTAQHGLF